MNTILTIAKKEFKETFFSPIAYVFISVFLFMSYWIFFSNFFIQGQASLRQLFNFVPILFLIFLPSTTMGRWSEEKKSGTLETLFTLPVKDFEVVLGKFLAVFLFMCISILLTVPAAITASIIGDLDWGVVAGGYLGLIFLGASYLSIGLFISSLTENQIVAFIVSVVFLFLMYFLGAQIVLNYMPDFLASFLSFVSLHYHFESIARGVIDSRDVLYYLSMTGFFIYLNVLSLERRQW